MTDPAISLVPVRAAELAVGKPLKEAIYDWQEALQGKKCPRLENHAGMSGINCIFSKVM